jgi:rRNA maturation endonuclease Nob1
MKCEYCDNIVDSNLNICPHCGAPIKKVVVVHKVVKVKDNSKQINLALISIIIICIILIGLFIFIRLK